MNIYKEQKDKNLLGFIMVVLFCGGSVFPFVAGCKVAGCNEELEEAPMGPRAPIGAGGREDYINKDEQTQEEEEEEEETPAHYEVNDENIKTAVTSALIFDERVPTQKVEVAVKDEIVNLTGVVNTLQIKARSGDIAMAVKGVRSVLNNLKVSPVDKDDEKLAEKVRSALLSDPATETYDISVSASNGVVHLSGKVDTWQEKQLASRVVGSVRGVTSIENKLDIEPSETRPDNEIRSEIMKLLDMDVRIEESLIKVDVNNGIVKLIGKVGSAAEKRRAVRDAWVIGAREVDASELEVKWLPLAQLRAFRYEPVIKSDEEIRETIKQAFKYDPRVKSYNPMVSTKDGVVTLTGTVDNLPAKKSAKEIARMTEGVRRVENHLRVTPQKILDDEEIEKRVIEKLSDSPLVGRHKIEVNVNNGVVFLDGTVASRYEKGRSGFLAAKVPSVVEVKNYLILPDQRKRTPDWVLEERIHSNIYWSPYIDSDPIEVEVSDGAAYLTGRVSSWFERRKVIEKAWRAGPRSVHDRLRVGKNKKWTKIPFVTHSPFATMPPAE